MTVRVSKPAFNLREKISELDKPTGIKGSELLKTNTIQEARDLIGAGRKNLIINGNFDVWQRGTTFSSFNTMRYTADRWLQYAAGSSTITATQQPFTVGQTEVPGNPKYYYRMDNTPDPNTAWMELFYRIEDVTRFSGVPVTLSFWMRANKPQIGEDEMRLLQNFGNNGSAAVTVRGPLFDIGTSWKKYEFTFDLPSITGKTIESNNFLQIHLVRVSNAVAADTYYDLAQFQLEYGRAATTFEQRSLGEELHLCKRYYQQVGPASSGVMVLNGAGNGTGRIRGMHQLVPEMRVAPTVTHDTSSENPTFYAYKSSPPSYSSVNGFSSTSKVFFWDFNTSTHNQVGYAFDVKGSGARLQIDAELPSTYSP